MNKSWTYIFLEIYVFHLSFQMYWHILLLKTFLPCLKTLARNTFINGYHLAHKVTGKGQQLCSVNEQKYLEAGWWGHSGIPSFPSSPPGNWSRVFTFLLFIFSLLSGTPITQMLGNILSGTPLFTLFNLCASWLCLSKAILETPYCRW